MFIPQRGLCHPSDPREHALVPFASSPSHPLAPRCCVPLRGSRRSRRSSRSQRAFLGPRPRASPGAPFDARPLQKAAKRGSREVGKQYEEFIDARTHQNVQAMCYFFATGLCWRVGAVVAVVAVVLQGFAVRPALRAHDSADDSAS